MTSNQLRRDAVLRHIARYGLTLRPVLANVFYRDHEKTLDRDLERMREYDWIAAVENAIPEEGEPQTKFSYYQLTTTGARRIGAAKSRARKLGGEALSRNLCYLWFCCMRSQRRHRLTEEDMVDLFGQTNVFGTDEAGKDQLRLRGFHCLDRNGDSRYRVLNLYAPRTSVGDVIVELRKRIRDVRSIPAVADAIEAEQYAFAVLTETAMLRDELRDELAKSLGREGVVFLVAKSPGSWKQTNRNA